MMKPYVTPEEIMADMPQERQERIRQRTQELIAEEMALQELRKALGMTQNELADRLKSSQDNISRLENRSDVMISSLRRYIEAMGGELNLVAKFPGKPPVEISSFVQTPS